MKKILLPVLTFTLLVCSSFSKDQWIFLGDSLTVGTIGNGKQFTRQVKERWGRDIKVINKSVVGKHTYEYKAEID